VDENSRGNIRNFEFIAGVADTGEHTMTQIFINHRPLLYQRKVKDLTAGRMGLKASSSRRGLTAAADSLDADRLTVLYYY
jgi:hypothetical protein